MKGSIQKATLNETKLASDAALKIGTMMRMRTTYLWSKGFVSELGVSRVDSVAWCGVKDCGCGRIDRAGWIEARREVDVQCLLCIQTERRVRKVEKREATPARIIAR